MDCKKDDKMGKTLQRFESNRQFGPLWVLFGNFCEFNQVIFPYFLCEFQAVTLKEEGEGGSQKKRNIQEGGLEN